MKPALSHILIVGVDQPTLDTYKRLLHPYANVTTELAQTGATGMRYRSQELAVIIVCCDSLGLLDCGLLQFAHRRWPKASKIVLAGADRSSTMRCTVPVTRYERQPGDVRNFLTLVLIAMGEHRMLYSNSLGAARESAQDSELMLHTSAEPAFTADAVVPAFGPTA